MKIYNLKLIFLTRNKVRTGAKSPTGHVLYMISRLIAKHGEKTNTWVEYIFVLHFETESSLEVCRRLMSGKRKFEFDGGLMYYT